MGLFFFSGTHRLRHFLLPVFAVAGAVFSFTGPAMAGFEWVPPAQPAPRPAPSAPAVAPAPPAAAPVVPVDAADDKFLPLPPLPGMEGAPAQAPGPAAAPQPHARVPAAQHDPIKRSPPQGASVSAVSQDGEPAPVIKVKTLYSADKEAQAPAVPESPAPVLAPRRITPPSEAMAPPPIPREVKRAPGPRPSPAQGALKESIEQTALPPIPTKTRVVMPEGAPESAVSKMGRSGIGVVETSAPVHSQGQKGLNISAAPELSKSMTSADMIALPDMPPVKATGGRMAQSGPQGVSAPAPVPPEDASPVVGFGKDMPLAIAMQQVLPPGFSYSFAESVNPGQRVSWNGGKAWSTVLQDMIAPLGLHAKVNGKHVHITSAGHVHFQGGIAPVAATGNAKKNVNINEPAHGLRNEPASDIGALALNDAVNGAPGLTRKDAKQKEAQDTAAYLNMIESAAGESPRRFIQDPGQLQSVQPQETVKALEQKVVLTRKVRPVETEAQNASVLGSSTSGNVQEIEAVVAQAPQALADEPQSWSAQKGASLKETLNEWAERSGYQLLWEASHDYRLGSDIVTSGPFEEALKTIVTQGLENGAPALFLSRGGDVYAKAVIIRDPRAAA